MNGVSAFLSTDPQDAGCARTMDLLHIYADLEAAAARPERRFPDVAAHLGSCDPCAEDLATLVAAVQGTLQDER